MAEDGCTALVTSTCSTALLCERAAPADCVDPTWAEWPMPNGPLEVAAGAPNPEAYTNNGDQTITDNVTGLMWQRAALTGTTYTWVQALAYCPTLTLAGHNDWRLPSRIELVSIIDAGEEPDPSNGMFSPVSPLTYFWSSSPRAGSPSLGWLVSFIYGSTTNKNLESVTYGIRCVR